MVTRSPLNSVQIPPNANRGRSSFSANHTTSFLPVAGFGSGAYSAKLLAGTRQRFSGFSQPRQCGEVVLRILVTGKPPATGPYRRLDAARARRKPRLSAVAPSGKFSAILTTFGASFPDVEHVESRLELSRRRGVSLRIPSLGDEPWLR
jgi:hypothetical protein